MKYWKETVVLQLVQQPYPQGQFKVYSYTYNHFLTWPVPSDTLVAIATVITIASYVATYVHTHLYVCICTSYQSYIPIIK